MDDLISTRPSDVKVRVKDRPSRLEIWQHAKTTILTMGMKSSGLISE